MRRLSLLVVAIVFTALNLRFAVASVPPLLDDLERELGMSSALAGLLTALPVLCFGVAAVAGAPLARRLGVENAILLSLVPLAVGTALRAAGPIGLLFLGTVVAGAGAAIGNVLIPALIKARYPSRIGPLMGVHTGVLGFSAAVAGGTAVPLYHALGWQGALAIWAIPALAAIALLAFALARLRWPSTVRGGFGDIRSLLRSGLAWQVTIFFAIQSSMFYCGLTWLPSILRDNGFSPEAAGALDSVYALIGVPASLAAPLVAARFRDQRGTLIASAGLVPIALAGLTLAPGLAVLWVPIYGLGQGACFAIALLLMALRAPDGLRSAELSGMSQGIGYSLAALGPLLVGVLHDIDGGWTAPLVFLLVLTIPMLLAGWGAARERLVPAARPV